MLRVLVVGDIRLYREGVTARLRGLDDIEVSESAVDERLRVRFDQDPPEVVLVDVTSSRGVELVRWMADLHPDTRVIVLGVAETEDEIMPCVEAGIAGYVPRDGSLDDLMGVVDSVRKGESIVSRRIAASLLRRVGALAAESSFDEKDALLTPREGEIAGLLEQGLSNKQIAGSLGIRVPTVKNHVHAILGKLQVHRRGQVGATLRRRGTGWRQASRQRRRCVEQDRGLDRRIRVASRSGAARDRRLASRGGGS